MPRRLFQGSVAALVLLAAYLYGALSYKENLPPLTQFVEVKNYFRYGVADVHVDKDAYAAYSDVSDREEVDCAALRSPKTAVIFAAGQSNAANRSETYEPLRTTHMPVFNEFGGKCYKAKAPLLGADGEGNSVWIPLAEQLIKSERYDSVVIAVTARSGAFIARWVPGNQLFARLETTQRDLRSAGLSPTHFLWLQGESDQDTAPADYTLHFKEMVVGLRRIGMNAPISVAVATYCEGKTSEPLRQAQRSLGDSAAGVRVGPDADQFGAAFRLQRCHLNDEGKERLGAVWATMLD